MSSSDTNERARGGWIKTRMALPKAGEIVETKIDDADGKRNEQRLKIVNNLWFVPDGSLYVYYEPTHWRPIDSDASDS